MGFKNYLKPFKVAYGSTRRERKTQNIIEKYIA